MNWTPAAPAFSFSVSTPSEIETDLLIVPVFEADSLDDIGDLTAASDGHLQRAFASGEIKGRPFEWLMTPLSGWKAPRVAVIGAIGGFMLIWIWTAWFAGHQRRSIKRRLAALSHVTERR